MASLVLGYSKKTQWKVQEMKAGHKRVCHDTPSCETIKKIFSHNGNKY